MTTLASRRTSRAHPKSLDTSKPDMPDIDERLLNQVQDVVGGLSQCLLRILAVESSQNAHMIAEPEKLAEALSPALTAAFVQQFLGSKTSTRKHRALLVHLLNTAELDSLAVPVFTTAASFVPEEPLADVTDNEELTSEEAAKLLHVSRTHLNTLVDEGKLPSARTRGGHRRIPRSAVLAYREQMRAAQSAGLERMMDASERLGLYDEELEGLPVRRKR